MRMQKIFIVIFQNYGNLQNIDVQVSIKQNSFSTPPPVTFQCMCKLDSAMLTPPPAPGYAFTWGWW